MKHKGNFKQWFNVFLIISEAWQGYKSKAYGVSDHHQKLQSKKFSRMWDIPNFPTQGWVDTAFCTSSWNHTYVTRWIVITYLIHAVKTSNNVSEFMHSNCIMLSYYSSPKH